MRTPIRALLVAVPAVLAVGAWSGARAVAAASDDANAESPSGLDGWQRFRLETSEKVGRELVEAVSTAGTARVMISFDVRAAGTGDLLKTFAGAPARAALSRAADDVLGAMPRGHFALARRFASVNAVAGEIDAEGLVALLDHPAVKAVDLDLGGTGALAESIPLAAIDKVRKRGKHGRGIVVGVIDSGMDMDHPSLKKARKGEHCFCSGGGGCCPDGGSEQSGDGSAEDENGHGTNVSGIIASRGKGAPRGGARKSKIVSVKVLDRDNAFCCSSDVIAALDWIITDRPDVDVVNMSLGTSRLFSGNCDAKWGALSDAYATAINTLWDAGVPVFASSGNDASRQMGLPACIKKTLSVGAVYDEPYASADWGICKDGPIAAGQLTCFSNTNKTTDLVAPGAQVTSTGLGGGSSTFSGTSQAAPMAATCAVLLKKAYPEATPADLEAALESSSVRVSDRANRAFPLLDCEEAFAFLGDR